MGNIILFFITEVIIISVIYFIYRVTKKSCSFVERIANIVFVVIEVTLLFIYYMDRFNIPTELGWHINVNSQNWLSFIVTYTASIMSAGIAAIVSVLITIYQIKENNKQNEQRDSKNAKIQNMPILKYIITTNKEMTVNFKNTIFLKEKDGILYPLNISIKNIGMNTIRNLKVDLEFDENLFRLTEENSQEPLEKGEVKDIDRWLNLPCENNEYKIKLRILYQDILTNWYTQEVELNYKTTNICEKGEYKSYVDFIVKEER